MEISAALASARAFAELAKTALAARDDAKVRGAIADLETKLYEATSAALASAERSASLRETVVQLENECRRLELERAERESYLLAEIRSGAYAYAGSHVENGQHTKTHYLCQPCYDKSIKAVLRYSRPRKGVDGVWECPETASHAIVDEGTAVPFSPSDFGVTGSF